MNSQVKSSQVKSSTFDRLPYGCLLFLYRLDLIMNTHSTVFHTETVSQSKMDHPAHHTTVSEDGSAPRWSFI